MNETAATGGVMYMDEGELEFDADAMAAHEGQRLVAVYRFSLQISGLSRISKASCE